MALLPKLTMHIKATALLVWVNHCTEICWESTSQFPSHFQESKEGSRLCLFLAQPSKPCITLSIHTIYSFRTLSSLSLQWVVFGDAREWTHIGLETKSTDEDFESIKTCHAFHGIFASFDVQAAVSRDNRAALGVLGAHVPATGYVGEEFFTQLPTYVSWPTPFTPTIFLQNTKGCSRSHLFI